MTGEDHKYPAQTYALKTGVSRFSLRILIFFEGVS